ncbi:MAG TPA: c-type cytochrome [Roseiarcus sp.]|nr:c-type cytochrome [Roseiarcus sp.]
MTTPSRFHIRPDAAVRRPLMALAFGVSAALSTGAATAADAAHGEQLARRWCAACHIVSADQTHGADNAPAFATVAKIPGFDADKIAKFLMDPHPKMPDMQLGRDESKDLAAYIASLAQ